MAGSQSFLKTARLIHLYLGVFIAPALIFFAITGALQTAGLHETSRGSDYKPPVWVAKLAQLHKKQTLALPERRPQSPAANKPAETSPSPASAAPSSTTKTSPPAPATKATNPLPMKIFFVLVSVGLLISTLTGIFMAYRYNRSKTVISALLIAGVAVPLLLLLF